MKKLLASIAIASMLVTASAQTNNPPPEPPKTVQPIPANIKADIMKLVSDILDAVNLRGLLQAGIAAWGAARVLRKVLPDKMQANNFGQLLAHLALEVNPTLNAPPQLTAEEAVARAKAQLAVIPPISPATPPADAPKT